MRLPRQSLRPKSSDASTASPYGLAFWLAYGANTSVMIAVALLFRYADFVMLLGGGEWHLGWIVGMGMVGSLLVRYVLGSAIDRHGPRRVWMLSLGLAAIACLGHLGVARYDTAPIYLLRIAYCSGLAGVFGASMTFISTRAPARRMAEMIGMLGTSGFVGMTIGTQIADLLLAGDTVEAVDVHRMFLVAGGLFTLAMGFAWMATRGTPVPFERRRVAAWGLLRRYHPGWLLLVGLAMGAGIGLPGTFLRTYAATLGISAIGPFFSVYAPTAMVTRLSTRRLPERLGTRTMILIGLSLLIVAQLLFLVVRAPWQLFIPGMVYGMAHAILFPNVVAGGAAAFPERHRGLGTTLMLATFDAGVLIGAPLTGATLELATRAGLPAYATFFVGAAATLAVIAAIFAATGVRSRAGRQTGEGPARPSRLAVDATSEQAVEENIMAE